MFTETAEGINAIPVDSLMTKELYTHPDDEQEKIIVQQFGDEDTER